MGSLDADDYIDHRETYKKNWTEMEVNINDLLVYYWAAEQSIAQEISADLKMAIIMYMIVMSVLARRGKL